MTTLMGRRYTIVDELGIGGMGTVYRAVDRLTGQTVALKHVHQAFDQTTPDETLRLAVSREFRVLGSLRHPNIISVIDYGFDRDGQPYYTMDLIENARTILQAADDQPVEEQMRLIFEMLNALAYLHRRNVIHSDLKPGNVLVDQNRVVKVLDFGLSFKTSDSAADGQRKVGGTLLYMAPEMLTEEITSPSSDLYAAGLIIYEIFNNRHPFQANHVGALINAILTVAPDVSRMEAGLAQVVKRLLSKKPEERPKTAEETMLALSDSNYPMPAETHAVRESFLQAAHFVGRDQEIAHLSHVLDEAIKGWGSLWLIGAESGAGKSRLLDEIRIRAMVQGVLVLRGQGVNTGGFLYHYWREPVRHLVLSTPLSDFDAGILKTIIPDIDTLLEREVIEAPELDSKSSQQRLIASIVKLFESQPQPILLILEDLQWASESLEVLKKFIAAIGKLPMLILGSYRDDERPTLPHELPGANLMKLKRLSPEAICELSASMLGDIGKDETIISLLQRETEGNAFFVVETVRALAEEAGNLNQINPAALSGSILAKGIQQLIHQRLDRVPESARPLLKIAAVFGRRIDLNILRIIDQPLNVDDWLTMCVNTAIIDMEQERWQFAHDKLREALLADLTADEQVSLNRLVARAIEYIYPNDETWSSSLMKHWRVAGDEAKEAYYTCLTAEQFYRVSDFKEARHLYERAVALMHHFSDQQKLEIIGRLAHICWLLSDYANSTTYYEESLRLARSINYLPGIAAAYAGIGSVVWQQGDRESSKKYFEDAIALAREANDMTNIALYLNRLGVIKWLGGDLTAAYECHHESLRVWESLHDQFGIARALNNLGALAATHGDIEAATDYYVKSLNIKTTLGDLTGIASTLNNLGDISQQSGKWDEAIEYYQDSHMICVETGEKWASALALGNLVWTYFLKGDMAQALERLPEALAVGREINATARVLFATACYAWLHLLRGEVQRGAQLLGFVMHHPTTEKLQLASYKKDLYPRFQAVMSEIELEAALVQGAKLDYETVVGELI